MSRSITLSKSSGQTLRQPAIHLLQVCNQAVTEYVSGDLFGPRMGRVWLHVYVRVCMRACVCVRACVCATSCVCDKVGLPCRCMDVCGALCDTNFPLYVNGFTVAQVYLQAVRMYLCF